MSSPTRTHGSERWGVPAAAALLICAAILVYSNTFRVPFVFDDGPSIVKNLTIRNLSSIGTVLSPPHLVGETVGGRPLLNVTFAINYAISGLEVWSYHVVNLLIHILAGLTLFGVLRRTFAGLPIAAPRFSPATQAHSLLLATLAALLFVVHPLETESVTYIVQRAESLVALFFLLTLYAFIRSVEPDASHGWMVLAVASCALGMATKEVMVTAPVIVLLYDRTFVAGTFRSALQRRWRIYLSLAATWLILLMLVLNGGRGASAGLDSRMNAGFYLLTQARAVVHYLVLTIWPHPLVFDYGRAVNANLSDVAGYVGILLVLFSLTMVALRRRAAVGFAAAAVFLILAPSSSVIPIVTQSIAEHRMYLPLAAVISIVVVAIYELVGQQGTIAFAVLSAAGLGWLTHERNADYATNRTLWERTVAAWPENPRAQFNLSHELLASADTAAALPLLESAVRLDSTYASAQNDLGLVLGKSRHFAEARNHFAAALRSDPDLAEARFNYATILVGLGELDHGIAEFQELERRHPEFPNLHAVYGTVLVMARKYPEAADAFRITLREKPDSVAIHVALGDILVQLNQLPEAIEHYQTALRLDPGLANVRASLDAALARQARRP